MANFTCALTQKYAGFATLLGRPVINDAKRGVSFFMHEYSDDENEVKDIFYIRSKVEEDNSISKEGCVIRIGFWLMLNWVTAMTRLCPNQLFDIDLDLNLIQTTYRQMRLTKVLISI